MVIHTVVYYEISYILKTKQLNNSSAYILFEIKLLYRISFFNSLAHMLLLGD